MTETCFFHLFNVIRVTSL